MTVNKQHIKQSTMIATVASVDELLMALADMPRRVEFPEILEKIGKIDFREPMEVWVMNDFMFGTSSKIDIMLRPVMCGFDPVRFLMARQLIGSVMMESGDGSPAVGWFGGARPGTDAVVYWISSWHEGFPRGIRAMSMADFPIRAKGINWAAVAATDPAILNISDADPKSLAKLLEMAPEQEGKLRFCTYIARISSPTKCDEIASIAMIEDTMPGGFGHREDLADVAKQIFGPPNNRTHYLG